MLLIPRKKSHAEKASALATSALSSFERTAADLHHAADMLDDAAEDAFVTADHHYAAAANHEALGAQHSEEAGLHRNAAERIAYFLGG